MIFSKRYKFKNIFFSFNSCPAVLYTLLSIFCFINYDPTNHLANYITNLIYSVAFCVIFYNIFTYLVLLTEYNKLYIVCVSWFIIRNLVEFILYSMYLIQKRLIILDVFLKNLCKEKSAKIRCFCTFSRWQLELNPPKLVRAMNLFWVSVLMTWHTKFRMKCNVDFLKRNRKKK